MAESHLNIAVKRIRKDRLAVAGFCLICLFALVALLDTISVPTGTRGACTFQPHGPRYPGQKAGGALLSPPLAKVGVLNRKEFTLNAPPSRHNIRGEDVFYNALKGIRTAFIIGIVPLIIASFFAVVFGLLAGYYGGWVEI